MLSQCLETKKAAGRAATAATDTIRTSAYKAATPLSSETCTKGDGAALGLLLLALEVATLPRAMRRCAWILAEKWASEYVGARHQAEAA